MNTIRSSLEQRFNRFLKKRMPAASHHRLSNRNIFILPSKFGVSYLFAILVIFLLGTNYQNNLILLASYLFASLFFTGMLYSFFNMSKVEFQLTSQVYGYANQYISVPLKVLTGKDRYDFSFVFKNNKTSHKAELPIGETVVNIPFYSGKRGLHNTGRLKISSEYIFGLFTCWTNLDFDCVVTTYPEKRKFNQLQFINASQHEEVNGSNIVEGGDDFGELREYRTGESNAQIAWKQLARGQGRLTKTTQQELGSTIWLSLDDLPAAPIETKLEMLCFLILDQHKHGTPFGLKLRNISIEPAVGNAHTHQCLSALAKYQQPSATKQPENKVSGTKVHV